MRLFVIPGNLDLFLHKWTNYVIFCENIENQGDPGVITPLCFIEFHLLFSFCFLFVSLSSISPLSFESNYLLDQSRMFIYSTDQAALSTRQKITWIVMAYRGAWFLTTGPNPILLARLLHSRLGICWNLFGF